MICFVCTIAMTKHAAQRACRELGLKWERNADGGAGGQIRWLIARLHIYRELGVSPIHNAILASTELSEASFCHFECRGRGSGHCLPGADD